MWQTIFLWGWKGPPPWCWSENFTLKLHPTRLYSWGNWPAVRLGLSLGFSMGDHPVPVYFPTPWGQPGSSLLELLGGRVKMQSPGQPPGWGWEAGSESVFHRLTLSSDPFCGSLLPGTPFLKMKGSLFISMWCYVNASPRTWHLHWV